MRGGPADHELYRIQRNQDAFTAKSIRYGGLTHDEALKLVTINPAIQLGIDKRVGSIDVGKDADLVIYNHDPLSDYAVAQKTIIDGRVYFDRQRDIGERSGISGAKSAGDTRVGLGLENRPVRYAGQHARARSQSARCAAESTFATCQFQVGVGLDRERPSR